MIELRETGFVWPTIQPKETSQQFNGRCKREINAWNKALNLQPGEPVFWGKYGARYYAGMSDPHRPRVLERLTGEKLAAFLAYEADQNMYNARMTAMKEASDALYARPEAQAAFSVRCLIEDHLAEIIDRMTPQQWIDLHETLKLVPKEEK